MASHSHANPNQPGPRSFLAADKILTALRARGVEVMIPRSEMAQIVHECTDFSKTMTILSECATFLCNLPYEGEPMEGTQATKGEALSRDILRLISEARNAGSNSPVPPDQVTSGKH